MKNKDHVKVIENNPGEGKKGVMNDEEIVNYEEEEDDNQS